MNTIASKSIAASGETQATLLPAIRSSVRVHRSVDSALGERIAHFKARRCLALSFAVFAALFVRSEAIAGPTLYVTSVFEPTFAHGRIEIERIEIESIEAGWVTADWTVREPVREVGGGLRGIEVDVRSNSLFWTDVNSDRIERVDLNAPWRAPSGVVTTGLSFPQDLELSISAGKLFWSDSTLKHVETSNLDGTRRSVLFSALTTTVGVDDVNGKIYSENRSTAASGSIVRSNFDGTEFEEVIKNVPTANDIAIDPLNEVIYWTSSAGLASGNGGVYRVDFDGTNFAEIFVLGSNLDAGGIALDLANGKVYWSQEWRANRDDIYRMNLDGSDPEIVATGFGAITDIDLVPDQRISVTIDINPGAQHAVMNPRLQGVVWVAVLSDIDNATAFDPLQIDIRTVRFGPDGATTNRHRVRDVNKDGVADLFLQFWIQDTGIQCGDAAATLTGDTFDGLQVTGTDSIKTVGCQGRYGDGRGYGSLRPPDRRLRH